jgi:hypothetical protein
MFWTQYSGNRGAYLLCRIHHVCFHRGQVYARVSYFKITRRACVMSSLLLYYLAAREKMHSDLIPKRGCSLSREIVISSPHSLSCFSSSMVSIYYQCSCKWIILRLLIPCSNCIRLLTVERDVRIRNGECYPSQFFGLSLSGLSGEKWELLGRCARASLCSTVRKKMQFLICRTVQSEGSQHWNKSHRVGVEK